MCDIYPTSHENGSPGAPRARQDSALTVWALVYDDRLSEPKTTVHYPRGRGGGEVGHKSENVGMMCGLSPMSHENGSPGAPRARQDVALTARALVYDNWRNERKTTVRATRGGAGGGVNRDDGRRESNDPWTPALARPRPTLRPLGVRDTKRPTTTPCLRPKSVRMRRYWPPPLPLPGPINTGFRAQDP